FLPQPGEDGAEARAALDVDRSRLSRDRDRRIDEAAVVPPGPCRDSDGAQHGDRQQRPPDGKTADAIGAMAKQGSHPAQGTRNQPAAASARSSPRALARVSSSSRSATESTTIPAPARSETVVPSCTRVRMRMLRSRSPLRSRYPIEPV